MTSLEIYTYFLFLKPIHYLATPHPVAMNTSTVLLWILIGSSSALQSQPILSTPVSNVSIPLGGDVNLTCVVENYNLNYTVTWFYANENKILSYHWFKITSDERFSIINPEPEQWILNIQHVKLGDWGHYNCGVNTVPKQEKSIFLSVETYVEILEDSSSSPSVLSIEEGKDANFSCIATGNPLPTVTWYRLADGNKTEIQNGNDKHLILHQMTRSEEGQYLCVANNIVDHPVSKTFTLKIKFSPIVTITKKSVIKTVYDDVYLNCYIECNPTCYVAWLKNETLLSSNEKHEIYQQNHGYNIHTMLSVHNPEFDDFGPYECVAVNYLGSASEFVTILPTLQEENFGTTNTFKWMSIILLIILTFFLD